MKSPAPGQPVFSAELKGNSLVVSAQAELSSLQADIEQQMGQVMEQMHRTGAKNFVLDLSKAQYFGTAMLGAMVKVWKKVSQGGGQMVLCNVHEGVQEVLRLTKLHTLWPIYASCEEALRSLDS